MMGGQTWASNQTGRGRGARGKDMHAGGQEKRRAALAAALWSAINTQCNRGGGGKPSAAKTAAAAPEPRQKEVGVSIQREGGVRGS